MIPAWLSLDEFMRASGRSRSAIFRDKRLGVIETRKDAGKLQISSNSLPPTVREHLSALSAAPKELRPAPPTPQAPARLFADADVSGPGKRIALSPEAERLAAGRLEVIRPLCDFCSDKTARARYSLLHLRDGRQVRKADDLADYLVETRSTPQQKLSRATLWAWKKRFTEQGLPGLARKLRADKGSATWVSLYPAAAELVAATWLQPFRSKQLAFDALADSQIIPANALPSYQSVCTWLETIPKAAVVLAREGERSHNERMAPYLSRGYIDIAPGQVYVADTMLFDVLVRNDCFGAEPDSAAIRVQLTAIQDLRSRKIVGYAFVLNGSHRSITTALRMAIERCGLPRTMYFDNGSDFKKVAHGARPANALENAKEEFEVFERSGALLQLGVDVQFCIPYHPQSKPIERAFGTLHGRFDKQFPHYVGEAAGQRPDGTVVAAVNHGKLLRFGAPEQSPLMPASHFIRMAGLWIEDFNATHKHSGRGMGGRTPDEVFAPALENKRPFDPSVLNSLLWSRERRRVRECSVTVAGRRLIGESAHAAEVLYKANELDVVVYWDPNAPQTGVVTDLDGHKLCSVRAEQFAPHSAAAAPMIQASMKQRRGLRNNTAQSIRELRKRVSVMGHKPALQILSERAFQLPQAVGDSIVHPVEPRSYAAPTHFHSEDIGDQLAASLLQRTANGS